jgi:hypothetical protein
MTDHAVGAEAKPDWLVPATGLFLVVALACGGSSSSPISAGIVRVTAAPILAAGLLRLRRDDWKQSGLWPLMLAAAAAAWVLIQLIPLPPSVWTALPGRSLYARTYQAAGMPLPWLPIDLDAWAGWRALFGFLPPMAILAVMPGLTTAERRWLAYVVLIAALASAALGMAQMAGGPASPLRVYAVTNRDAAVGFFANRNHEASFLAATLPLVGYLAVRGMGREGGQAIFWLGAGCAFAFVVVIGAAASGSRAGMGLAFLGAVGALVVAARALAKRPGPAWRRVAMAWPALTAVLVAAMATFTLDPSLAHSLEARLGGDLRFALTPVTAQAGMHFAPVGSGAGTFDQVYPMFEPLTDVGPAHINHAHDDLAEVWLEAGAPGLVLIGALAFWWIRESRAAMSERRRSGAALSLAGAMIVGMLLTHSLVDYPLRTPALAVYFAFALGLLTRPGGAISAAAS